jgi:hypothetical protein
MALLEYPPMDLELGSHLAGVVHGLRRMEDHEILGSVWQGDDNQLAIK